LHHEIATQRLSLLGRNWRAWVREAVQRWEASAGHAADHPGRELLSYIGQIAGIAAAFRSAVQHSKDEQVDRRVIWERAAEEVNLSNAALQTWMGLLGVTEADFEFAVTTLGCEADKLLPYLVCRSRKAGPLLEQVLSETDE
jgi:hypothetical protein